MVQNILSTEEIKQSYFTECKKSNRKRRRGNTKMIKHLTPDMNDEQFSSVETKRYYQIIPNKINADVGDLEKIYHSDIDLSDYQMTRDDLINSIRKRREYQIIREDVLDTIIDLTIGVVTKTGIKKISDIEYMERIDYLKYQSYYSNVYYKACEPFDYIIYPVELCEICNKPYCNTCIKFDDIKDRDVDEQEYFSEDSSDDEHYDELGW